MPGFTALSTTPIAGAGSSLTAITAGMVAAGSIVFSSTAAGVGAVGLSATGVLFVSATPAMYAQQAVATSGTITFSGTPFLQNAGKPIRVFALPHNYTVRASLANYSVKAVPRSYTVRAKR